MYLVGGVRLGVVLRYLTVDEIRSIVVLESRVESRDDGAVLTDASVQ